MITFNQEQLKAINSTDLNTTVSASAGAGKTTVLVGRLMKRILHDNLSVKDILAMTFTEKAASEMKKRLQSELVTEFNKNHDMRLKEELTNLQNAQISTIHSFCLTITKEYGYLIGLDPLRTKTILNESQIYQLTQDALDTVLSRKFSSSNLENFETLTSFINSRVFNYEDIKDLILSLSQASLVHLDPKKWLLDIQNLYEVPSFTQLPQTIKDSIFALYQLHLIDIEDKLTDLLEESLVLEKKDEALEIDIKNMIEINKDLMLAVEEANFNKIKILSKKLLSIPIKTPTKSPEFTEVRNQVIDLFQNDTMKTMLLGDTTAHTSHLAKPLLNELVELTLDYQDEFENLKKINQGMTFDDIEHLAYQILIHESGFARSELQNKYKEILVDEFQDSNFFQNEIVNLLEKNNNVFRVGDIKQSIYKFRHARPSIMRDIMALDNQNFQTLYLSNNFRSTKNIVDFSNYLFNHVMNLEGLPDFYSDKDWVSIGDAKRQNPTLQKPISIVQIDTEQKVLQKYNNNHLEASFNKDDFIACFIAQDIVKKKREGKYIYKDICVLVKSHHRKNALKKYFELYEIPYYFNDTEGFYNADVVNDVLHFIEYFLNPHDDRHLLWVLMSKFFLLSSDDLARIKLYNPKQSLSTNLPSVFKEIQETLDVYHQLFLESNPVDFVVELIRLNDYYQVRCDLQQKTNIDLLISLLEDHTTANTSSWIGFIEMVEQSRKLKSSSAASESEEADVVKVMTVHASKGLQFPLVYLYSQTSNRQQELTSKILIDSDWGVSIMDFDKEKQIYQSNLLRYAFSQKIRLEEASENLRLLYVALTRPQKELIIVDTILKDKSELSLSDLLNGKIFTSVIIGSLSHIPSYLYQEVYPVIETLPERIVSKPQRITSNKKYFDTVSFDDLSQDNVPFNLSLKDTSLQKAKGTLFHQLINTLPHTLWDKNHLDQLNADDQDILLKYNRDEFTQTLYTKEIYHEVAIAYEQNNQVIYGYIDLVAIDDKEVIVVDFKTDSVDSSEKLIDRYYSQLMKYSQGLKLQYPYHHIKTYLYSFHLNQYIEVY